MDSDGVDFLGRVLLPHRRLHLSQSTFEFEPYSASLRYGQGERKCKASAALSVDDADEVADYLRVKVRTVYRMAKAGTIPSFCLGVVFQFNRGIER
jgi:excisionase family DNA binding protein